MAALTRAGAPLPGPRRLRYAAEGAHRGASGSLVSNLQYLDIKVSYRVSISTSRYLAGVRPPRPGREGVNSKTFAQKIDNLGVLETKLS